MTDLTALTEITTPTTDDILYIVDAPGSSKNPRKCSIANFHAVNDARTKTLTNTTIDANGTGNSITNIENADIKASAGIDATKIADGTVTSAEFQYLGDVTGLIQGQLNAKAPLASPAFTGTATGANLTLSGDLTVNGTNTILDTTTLSVEDKNIEIAKVDTPTDTTADGGGITIKGATDKTIIWDNTNDNLTSNQDWNVASGKSYKVNNVLLKDVTETLTNKTLTAPTLTTPALGTPASGILSGCTVIPMVEASGILPDANMPNLTGAITTVQGAVDTTLSANAVDSDHYNDGSIDLEHLANAAKTEALIVAASDNTTALTASTVFTFYMPYAMTLTDIKASVLTAPTGAELIVDVHDAGTTIMDTNKLDIDVTEFHTKDAGTQPVLSDTTLANNAKIEIIVDQIGSTVAGAGLVIYLIGYQT